MALSGQLTFTGVAMSDSEIKDAMQLLHETDISNKSYKALQEVLITTIQARPDQRVSFETFQSLMNLALTQWKKS